MDSCKHGYDVPPQHQYQCVTSRFLVLVLSVFDREQKRLWKKLSLRLTQSYSPFRPADLSLVTALCFWRDCRRRAVAVWTSVPLLF